VLRVAAGKASAEGGVSGLTFDAGGLMALDRSDRRVIALRVHETGARITIPTTALAQITTRRRRHGCRGWSAARPTRPLDGVDATQVGVLLGSNKTSIWGRTW
jgi:hypothetical protein